MTLIEGENSAREIIHGDAIPWLRAFTPRNDASFITSLPDVSELPELGLPGWRGWFEETAALILERTHPEAVAIFFQSDIRKGGAWVDKGHIVHTAADRVGARCLWHKIVCRLPAGTPSHGRATYSHMLCFSKGLQPNAAFAGVDVLAETGEMTWPKAMGINACAIACRYVKQQTQSRLIIDPFCGQGSVLAVANALGMAALGVDLSARRCQKARALRIRL